MMGNFPCENILRLQFLTYEIAGIPWVCRPVSRPTPSCRLPLVRIYLRHEDPPLPLEKSDLKDILKMQQMEQQTETAIAQVRPHPVCNIKVTISLREIPASFCFSDLQFLVQSRIFKLTLKFTLIMELETITKTLSP